MGRMVKTRAEREPEVEELEVEERGPEVEEVKTPAKRRVRVVEDNEDLESRRHRNLVDDYRTFGLAMRLYGGPRWVDYIYIDHETLGEYAVEVFAEGLDMSKRDVVKSLHRLFAANPKATALFIYHFKNFHLARGVDGDEEVKKIMVESARDALKYLKELEKEVDSNELLDRAKKLLMRYSRRKRERDREVE
ncbi:MAG: hypothetical protein ACK4SY_08740 [Pyrobaculum sp.]